MLARLCAMFSQVYGGSKTVKDFMAYLNVWDNASVTDPRYSETDREVLRALGGGA